MAPTAARANDQTAVIATDPPARLDFDVEDRLKQGWIATVKQGDKLDAVADTYAARLPAVYVAEKQSVTPYSAAEPFAVTLRGLLRLDFAGNYTFHFAGRGIAKMTINGKEIMSGEGDLTKATRVTVQLHRDFNEFEVRYESPPQSAAQFRLLWEGKSEHFTGDDAFAVEPLSPELFFHDPQQGSLQQANETRLAHRLLLKYNCRACHIISNELPNATGPRLGVTHRNPSLTGVGARFNEDWLATWIADAHSMRNHVTMPRLFSKDLSDKEKQEIADLVAFLQLPQTDATDATDAPVFPDSDTSATAMRKGELHFENLACIACHHFEPPNDEDYYQRTSLHYLDAKFKPGALIAFLQTPHAYYANSRMPDFRLSLEEAIELAAFLRDRGNGRIESPIVQLDGDITRGANLFVKRNCSACHKIDYDGDVDVSQSTIHVLKERDEQFSDKTGCLAATQQHRTAPDFALSEADRESLWELFASNSPMELSKLDSYASLSARQHMLRLRCTACHDRDKEYSVLSEVLVEEGVQGLQPGNIPALTWTGEKLKRDWMHKLLSGELDYRARPWLKARMPAFPAYARPIAHGVPTEHGFSGEERPRPNPNEQLAQIGYKLTGQFTGFYCTECHSAGGRPPTSAFDHRGIDFPYVTERLQYDYYHRWMADPKRIDPGTKMPQFAKQPKPDILGGEPRKQFDALWHYLRSLQR